MIQVRHLNYTSGLVLDLHLQYALNVVQGHYFYLLIDSAIYREINIISLPYIHKQKDRKDYQDRSNPIGCQYTLIFLRCGSFYWTQREKL